MLFSFLIKHCKGTHFILSTLPFPTPHAQYVFLNQILHVLAWGSQYDSLSDNDKQLWTQSMIGVWRPDSDDFKENSAHIAEWAKAKNFAKDLLTIFDYQTMPPKKRPKLWWQGRDWCPHLQGNVIWLLLTSCLLLKLSKWLRGYQKFGWVVMQMRCAKLKS